MAETPAGSAFLQPGSRVRGRGSRSVTSTTSGDASDANFFERTCHASERHSRSHSISSCKSSGGDVVSAGGDSASAAEQLQSHVAAQGATMRALDFGIVRMIADSSRALGRGLQTGCGGLRRLFARDASATTIASLRLGLTAEQRLARAAYFVQDAFAQRFSHGYGAFYGRNNIKMRLLQVCESRAYKLAVYAVMLLYIVLGAMRPSVRAEPETGHARTWASMQLGLSLADCVCAGVLGLDIVARCYLWGMRDLLGSVATLSQTTLVLVLSADTVVAALASGHGLAFVRCARAALLLKSRRVRGIFETIGATIPSALLIGFFLALMCVLYAILAIQLYGNVAGYAGRFDSFVSFLPAMRTLTVMLWTEGFPSTVEPAAAFSGFFAWLFFGSFVVIGSLIAFNLVLAMMVPLYKDKHLKRILQERVKERKALIAAFGLLEENSSGVIQYSQWAGLLPLLDSKATEMRIEVLFSMVDEDANGSLFVPKIPKCAQLRRRCACFIVHALCASAWG